MIEFDPSITIQYQVKAQFTGEWPRGGLWGNLYLVARDRICHDCNSGWMSVLQKEAGPRVGTLIAGRRILLSEYDLSVIAGWNTMMTMVLDCVPSDSSTWYFTQYERDRLRTDWEIPETSTFWLAYRVEEWKHLSVVSWGSGFTTEVISTRPSDAFRAPAKVATMSIFHAIFQMFIYRLGSRLDPGLSVMPTVEGPWLNKTIRFGPPNGPVVWPPPESITDSDLHVFARRWTPHPNPVKGASPEESG